MKSVMYRAIIAAALAAVISFRMEAQTKRAFIVGVGEYLELEDLAKTKNDARGYEALFANMHDFVVTRVTDPSLSEFQREFQEFLATVPAGDEVSFIFSGHGWSDGLENFLIMSDAPRDARELELKSQTVALKTYVLSELKQKNPSVLLAIIDACRDYPFSSSTKSSFQKGLMRLSGSRGSMIMYAAGDRQRALDRLSDSDASPYSVFTRVLLPLLEAGDRPIQDIARETSNQVADLALSINHFQRPAFYDELDGAYCLSGSCAEKTSFEAGNRQARRAFQDATTLNLASSQSIADSNAYVRLIQLVGRRNDLYEGSIDGIWLSATSDRIIRNILMASQYLSRNGQISEISKSGLEVFRSQAILKLVEAGLRLTPSDVSDRFLWNRAEIQSGLKPDCKVGEGADDKSMRTILLVQVLYRSFYSDVVYGKDGSQLERSQLDDRVRDTSGRIDFINPDDFLYDLSPTDAAELTDKLISQYQLDRFVYDSLSLRDYVHDFVDQALWHLEQYEAGTNGRRFTCRRSPFIEIELFGEQRQLQSAYSVASWYYRFWERRENRGTLSQTKAILEVLDKKL